MTKRPTKTTNTAKKQEPSKATQRAGDSADNLRPTAQIVISTLLMNVLAMGFPVLTLQVYDRIIPAHSTASLYILLGGVAVALGLETLINLSRTYLIGWSGATLEHRMACRLMQTYMLAEPGQLEKSSTGTHMQRFGAISTIKGLYNGEMLVTWLDGGFLLLFMGVMALVGGWLVLVPVGILTVFGAMNLRQGTLLKRWLMTRNSYDNRRYNFLIQSLKGVHTIKALCLEEIFQRRYEFMEKQSTMANYAIAGVHGQMFNSVALFSHLMVVGVMSVGALQVLYANLSVGVLVACILLSGRLMQPAQKLLQLWVRQQDFAVAEKQLNEVFALELSVRPSVVGWQQPEKIGMLELGQICVAAGPKEPLVLEDISLRMMPGEALLVDGRDEKARTLLLKTMTGHYRTQEGNVTIDGLNATHYPAHMLAEHVGYLSPQGVLFRGSILQNLTRFGRTDEATAMSVAEMLNLPEDIARLPGGFDTPLEGTLADTLSQDLKQGIALAAVLSARPRIVLYDEAGQGLAPQRLQRLLAYLARMQGQTALVLCSKDENVRSLATRYGILYRGRLVQHNGGVMPFIKYPKEAGRGYARAA